MNYMDKHSLTKLFWYIVNPLLSIHQIFRWKRRKCNAETCGDILIMYFPINLQFFLIASNCTHRILRVVWWCRTLAANLAKRYMSPVNVEGWWRQNPSERTVTASTGSMTELWVTMTTWNIHGEHGACAVRVCARIELWSYESSGNLYIGKCVGPK